MNIEEPCKNCKYPSMSKDDPMAAVYCTKGRLGAFDYCPLYQRDPHGYSEELAIGDNVVRRDDGRKAGTVFVKVCRSLWLIRNYRSLQCAYEDTVVRTHKEA